MSELIFSTTSSYSLPARTHKTLWLAALGGVLEFYDFVIFVFFANTIGHLFFPPNIPDWLRQFQTLAIFGSGYLARPLGGILMAHRGDLRGRKQMFTLSIFLMALPTLAIGLLPTYSVLGVFAPVLLLLLRIMQGMAIGGEVPGAWVFVSEHVPPSRIGLACGILTGGLTGGILLGSVVATLLNWLLTPAQVSSYGWRLAFVLGGGFGFLAVYLRRWLAETPIFEELRKRQALSAQIPLQVVIQSHRLEVILSGLLTWMLSAAIVVVVLMTPALLEKMYSIAPSATLPANSAATLALAVGCVFAGWLTDRIGPGRVLLIGAPLLGITTFLLYRSVEASPSLLLPFYALAGFATGVVAVVPVIMVLAFPAPIRFSGISFAYNIGYAVFGGLTPIFVSWLLRLDRLAPAYYVGALSLVGVGLGLFLFWSPRPVSTELA
ncbi:MAG: MFS transporter [Verrucomicrobia bacterium]|nr:MFS transporter [Verrucomicrobiota bacterium]